ncbi:MAG: FKBP-type peptidyl-prolyl cis-trans isomerase [Bacteroidales bacterium]|nr:FKBP-type peptidyl-prolyl cis-trans isomerase [Bacteroidales bacterium]MBP5373972.1 FKBP-type peptidyl-prolyl cis-trans isomerase [Bacteroidales bacterium]
MKRIIVILLCIAAAASCAKEALRATYDRQQTTIESFVAAQMKADDTATLTKTGGAYRLTLNDTRNLPDSLLWGGTVKLYYACYVLSSATISNSNLVATNKADVAEGAGWSLSDASQFQIATLKLEKGLVEGLLQGLYGVQEGDEGYVLFTGELGYGNSALGTIPARSALVYHIWVESISN